MTIRIAPPSDAAHCNSPQLAAQTPIDPEALETPAEALLHRAPPLPGWLTAYSDAKRAELVALFGSPGQTEEEALQRFVKAVRHPAPKGTSRKAFLAFGGQD